MTGPAVERVLSALDRVGCRTQTRGTGTRAQCPVHGSRGLTLSLRQGDRGAMLTCFAGCDLDDLLDAMTLTRRDLFDTDLPPGYVPPPRRAVTPWDPIVTGPGIEHLLHRVEQMQRAEATPEHWQRLADEFEAAKTQPGDYRGLRTDADRATHDAACDQRATACRRRAAVAAALQGGRS
jgi:hypothetical protein